MSLHSIAQMYTETMHIELEGSRAMSLLLSVTWCSSRTLRMPSSAYTKVNGECQDQRRLAKLKPRRFGKRGRAEARSAT